MARIFENKFMTIDFFEALSYFKVVRKGFDSDFSEEEYKDLMLQWRNQIEIYKPKYQMVDYMNFYNPIPLHIQKWINENLLAPALAAGMQKLAFIISRDLYAQVSIEQLMQEKEGKKFILKYFDNEPDGEQWLFE